ncbi:MAG: N-acetylneuraminate synthase family protein [Actinobacteria bacterium]|nr:N-acetylneuraminate synthase family protein [Actinomycetota bacterium]MBU1942458.1 N-acetylneuraminate synthase family protein [Actinomycetota bacterium]MBU2686330.1 N-acetylneuraminate synthase family protein [Actinomycetota bacterium]
MMSATPPHHGVSIGGRAVSGDEPAFLVGEIGVNHNGDLELARRLIDAAAGAGLDAVKFQLFEAEALVLRGTPKTGYQLETTGGAEDQLEMLRALELGAEELDALKRHATGLGLAFICTPYSPSSARALAEIGVAAIKIGSADLSDALLLDEAAATGLPIILSTGLATLAEVGGAVERLTGTGACEIALLHCVSKYPADPCDLNLRYIHALEEAFMRPVGFSDHTLGTDAAPLAVAAGACIIEKHFTLDRGMEGPDHRSSLDPAEMAELVRRVRAAELMLGRPVKELTDQEAANAGLMKRSLVFATDLPAGTLLEAAHLAAKRPSGGVPPGELEQYMGRVLAVSVSRDQQLSADLLKGRKESSS